MADTATDTQERRTIAVIDGNSLMHRAFHAVPPTMTAPDGRHTNAVFGFLNMFVKLVETFSPDGIICAFDKGKPRVRMEMLPQYKAQRPPTDPNLKEQFPMIKELLGAMEVPVVECEGWEGDDILGTLARAGEAKGYDMYLVTGDRDMYQLVTDHINVVSTRKGMSDVAIMTPESVDDLYHGITPELVPDFYGLKGDSSDNIPGVPGIGPKKAAALICEYGSLDGVIAHADEVAGKMGESLREHIDDALLSRKVATIRCDAPLDFEFSDARWPTFDPQTVRTAFGAFGIRSLTTRITAMAGASSSGTSATPESEQFSLGPILEGQALKDALYEADDNGEWIGFAPVDAQDEGTLFALDFELWVSCKAGLGKMSGDEARYYLVGSLLDGHVASGDIKALMHEVYPSDSSQAAHGLYKSQPPVVYDPALFPTNNLFDTGVAAYLLDSTKGSYPLSELCDKYLGVTAPEPTNEYPAAAINASLARQLVEPLTQKLKEDNAYTLFCEVEMPLVGVLARMERCGMHIDLDVLKDQSRELGADIDASGTFIYSAVGHEFNIDSSMQLSSVLFDEMGLPTRGLKKTQRGYYSTKAEVLEGLAQTNEVVAEVLRYREKKKIKSTYLDALDKYVGYDGRVHTNLNQTVTATGRLSSSNPNLQNIPTRSELGHRVRKAFTVPEGNVFLACDYSQIELRLLAHLSGDENLIRAFCEGEDFHAETAARVFGIPVAEVTHEQRSRAKAVNFGIVYGQQAYGLSTSLGISRQDAQAMIDRYFEAYPGVRRYLDSAVALARKNGWVETLCNRRRYICDIANKNPNLRNFAERTAMNHPMQGTAADIIKLAMIAVDKRMWQEGLKSKLVLQIHDELDFEVPRDELDTMSKLVKETMEGVIKLSVPLVAEVSYGADWAEAK